MAERIDRPTDRLPRPSRSWVKPTIVGCLILVCGMVIGSGLTLKVLWTRMQRLNVQPQAAPERLSKALAKTLALTPDQAQAVEGILRERQKALEGIRGEVGPRVEQELERARQEIEGQLTPQQKRRWSVLYERFHRRWTRPLRPFQAESPSAHP